ncbi:uncharacterized protein LOC119617635 isoform X3 [Kryptolebias marmoratus]|uniref:uncharacterized protein LOC119617635 isoform X3 n=1 Tax=Kryptolebias marmoratus TaxID=37003 RepID=UPI0018ACD49E|nr:uncharacterized protein LOC119617635 isoform X3 [Kryptolebias marmoratus]
MSSCNTSKCIRSPDSPTTTPGSTTSTTPAPSLQCVSCTDPECTSTELVTCDSGSMCITASIQANLTGTAEQRIYMDCAPSALCPTTGNRNFSVNLGFSSATASALCCNTSNCNSETLPFLLQFPALNPIMDWNVLFATPQLLFVTLQFNVQEMRPTVSAQI